MESTTLKTFFPGRVRHGFHLLGERLADGRADFFLLSAFALWLNAPFLNPAIWPRHDTIFAYQIFHAFYNNLFWNGELTRWLPYGTYGIQADQWLITILTPASYLGAALGLLFRITNTLLLFKCVAVLEILFFLFGLYLLARLLFKHRTTVLFVSIAGVGSAVWLIQLYFNFRFYYLLPLVLYLLEKFFRQRMPFYLWGAGLTFVASQIGNNTYFGIFNFVILTLYALFRSFEHGRAWSSLLPRGETDRAARLLNLASFAGLAAVGLLYLYFASHTLEGIVVHAPGREVQTLQASLKDFLSYGPAIGPEKFYGLLYADLPSHGGFTMYMGLPAVFFLAYAVCFARSRLFYSLSGVAFLIACFSLGRQTPVAYLAYHIPLMPYYRYIGLTGGVLRLFTVLSAGFGYECFLNRLEREKDNKSVFDSRRTLFWGIIILVAAALYIDVLNGKGIRYSKTWSDFLYLSMLLFVLTGLAVNNRNVSIKTVQALLLACLTFEMLSYQNLICANWRFRWPWLAKEVTQVAPYSYQAERSMQHQLTPRIRQATEAADKGEDRLSVEAYNFILFDPCFSMFFTLVEPERVWRLVMLKAPLSRARDLRPFLEDQNKTGFLSTIGCGLPKLRLLSKAVYAADSRQAEPLVKALSDPAEEAVLAGVSEALRSHGQTAAGLSAADLGHVQVDRFTFNRLEASVDVNADTGAWLYYADTYHPGWHAYVDNQEVGIAEANLAFKAIYVPQGKHTVKFFYFDGLRSVCTYLLAAVGVGFALTMLAGLGRLTFAIGKRPPGPHPQ